MNPWLDPLVAQQQRDLVDQQLAAKPWPPHFSALAEAVSATGCDGVITEIGCGSGHGREVLDRAGVPYRAYSGVDINPTAVSLAKQRYPESKWWLDGSPEDGRGWPLKADVIIDGSCVLHVDDWRAHLAALCRASRRWVILHRVPNGEGETTRTETQGYGHSFPAWRFGAKDLLAEMQSHGFVAVEGRDADGDSVTLTFAKPRHFCTYADAAYLPRLKALHASMVRHCGPFELHCLAFDRPVATWCTENNVPHRHVEAFLSEHPELDVDALPGPKRSIVEHMYTVGPAFVVDVMRKTGEPCSYIDADLFAFSSPEPFFAEAGGAPAAFVGHNFAPASRGTPGPTVESHAGRYGSLNVGVCHFNDRRVAERWSDLTRGWCFDRVEQVDGRWQFADQKYLEQLVEEFGAVVIKNEAAMVGPWNVNARSLDIRDGVPYFGNRPIGFYHFSSLQLGQHGQWSPCRPEYRVSERAINVLYPEYLRALEGR